MLLKKILTVVTACALAVSLAACGKIGGEKGSVKPELNNAWTVDSNIKYGDLDATAKITRNEKDNWEVEFASPNSLSGVRLCFTGDDVNASYKGLSFSVPKSALPYKALLGTLFTAVDDLAEKDNIKGEVKDGIVKIEGKADSGNYELGLDAKTGSLKSFEVPDYKASVQFENMTGNDGTDDAVLTTIVAEDAAAVTTAAAADADKNAAVTKEVVDQAAVTKEVVDNAADNSADKDVDKAADVTKEAIATEPAQTKEVANVNVG
jgi:hypothetical protein